MDREFLGGLNLEAEAIEKIMAEHGKTTQALKTDNENLTAERDGLKEQLETANNEIKSYKDMDIDGIKTAAETWEQKHKKDTDALRAQLLQKDYDRALEKCAEGIAFSSNSAKKAFLSDLSAKKLPLENDKLMGYDDFVKAYKENDPGAFASENQIPPPYAVGTGSNPLIKTSEEALKQVLGMK